MTTEPRWRGWLNRPAVIADAIVTMFGPHAKAVICRAVQAKICDVDDTDLAWRQAVWAMMAACTAICSGRPGADPDVCLETATVNILCLMGADAVTAKDIAQRPRRPLPTREAD